MTTILIAGATGLVGGLALASALSDARITQVVVPTRRFARLRGLYVAPGA